MSCSERITLPLARVFRILDTLFFFTRAEIIQRVYSVCTQYTVVCSRFSSEILIYLRLMKTILRSGWMLSSTLPPQIRRVYTPTKPYCCASVLCATPIWRKKYFRRVGSKYSIIEYALFSLNSIPNWKLYIFSLLVHVYIGAGRFYTLSYKINIVKYLKTRGAVHLHYVIRNQLFK